MPKKLINDYIFYKIVCISDDIDLCYVGSTANWKERQRTHKNACINENNKAYNNKKYKIIRENGGWENFKMIQLGTREQLTKREAEQIEEEYRVELKANMNTRRCYINNYYEENKDKIKQYYEDNKDKIKQYKEENRDKLLEYHQNYREENRDKINEYQQNYREENRNKINEKVKCECGCMISKTNLSIHKKTPKHINLMNNLNSL